MGIRGIQWHVYVTEQVIKSDIQIEFLKWNKYHVVSHYSLTVIQLNLLCILLVIVLNLLCVTSAKVVTAWQGV